MSLEAFDFKYLFELQIVFLEFSVPYYWVKTGHSILKIFKKKSQTREHHYFPQIVIFLTIDNVEMFVFENFSRGDSYKVMVISIGNLIV